jgi:hypothetical protein
VEDQDDSGNSKLKPSKNEVWKCPVCSKVVRHRQNIARHQNMNCRAVKVYKVKPDQVQKQSEFNCDYCEAKYSHQTSLTAHMKRGHLNEYCLRLGQSLFSCSECDFKSSAARYLKAHIIRFHTEKGTFVCEYCEKSYANKDSLKVHQKSHLSVKEVICHVCGSLCGSDLALLRHKCQTAEALESVEEYSFSRLSRDHVSVTAKPKFNVIGGSYSADQAGSVLGDGRVMAGRGPVPGVFMLDNPEEGRNLAGGESLYVCPVPGQQGSPVRSGSVRFQVNKGVESWYMEGVGNQEELGGGIDFPGDDRGKYLDDVDNLSAGINLNCVSNGCSITGYSSYSQQIHQEDDEEYQLPDGMADKNIAPTDDESNFDRVKQAMRFVFEGNNSYADL